MKTVIGFDGNTYWLGPYGVRVPIGINSIIYKDGGNRLSICGRLTEKYVRNPISKDEYIDTYCYKGLDNHYYYRVNQ